MRPDTRPELHEVTRPAGTMKALVYKGPGKRALEEKPKPAIQSSTDAILKVLKTTICGTDLHILKGDIPEVQEGQWESQTG
jgi:alcohol dehydrogenase